MRLLFVLALGLLSRPALAQVDSTRVADSTAQEERFSWLPGMPAQSARQSGHSRVNIPLKEESTVGLGISVYNAARGYVPGMQIDPYYQVDTLTSRTQSPLVVVDGITYNQSIGSYYNLNAFEYGNMQMVLGSNAAVPYAGGGGNRGAIVLRSRSGEGYSKPTFDFNTYTTYGWANDNNYSASQWNLSNSLGYSQDFGNLDLRVSTNYTAEPPGNTGIKGPSFWGLKANVGYTLNRFTARLILHRNTRWISNFSQGSFPGGQTQSSHSQVHDDLLQGNLMLAYTINNWLSLSGQVSQTHVTDQQSLSTNTYSRETTVNDRLNAGNILVHANKEISKTITLTGSFGWTTNSTYSNNTGTSSYMGYAPQTFSRSFEVSTQSILATADIGFKDKLFIGSAFRRDFVDYYLESDAYNAYSIYAGYAFNHLLDPSANVLSFSKIRASYGHNDNRLDTSVPRVGTVFPYAGVERTSALETGLELRFLKDRIQLWANYFQNTHYTPGPPTVPTDPVTGYTVTYLSYYYNTVVTGYEVSARMEIINNKRLNFATQFIAGRNTRTLESVGSPLVSASSNASSNLPWTGGWLNQITFRRISFSMLIDASSSSSYDFSVNRLELVDRSFVKIRDISVGYNFLLSPRMKGSVMMSFRNPVTLYRNSDIDFESNYFGIPSLSKSASLSFSLQF